LTCANRAHRWARVQRAKGLGYTSGAHLLSQSAASEARVKASLSDPLIAAQVSASGATTADITKALALSRFTDVDSEAELAELGYSIHKKAERWSDEPRAAEPLRGSKLSTPKSDEENPPQFINEEYEPNPDDPYADYQAPQKDDL